MNKVMISEVEVTPIKPRGGLVGFASCIVNDSIYIGSIGIHTRPKGGYRLLYPDKNGFGIVHPINALVADLILDSILEKYGRLVE